MSEPKVYEIMERIDKHLNLDTRVDKLEDRVTVLEQCVRNLQELPEIVTDFRIMVSDKLGALSAQSKVTWALLLLVISGLLGLAWIVMSR